MSTVNICIVNNIFLYAILYDILNIASDSRSLWHIKNTNNEMNHHGNSRALRRIKNAANQRKRRQDPARREEEQVADTARRRIAREQPGLRMARANKHVDMATKFVNGEHVFHQHCGTWDIDCVHGYGYIHLSSSTAGTQKKCCANGRLSSANDNDNFDEELMNEHELDPMPSFLARNVKRYLINYPHLFDYGQTIFCLSFPSRDRANAPGRYEQFYFTKHVPYPQKINFEDAIRSEDPVQLFCNSFCVQHKMVGDDYPSILQCLVYCHSAD
jgi:hypothetical protein